MRKLALIIVSFFVIGLCAGAAFPQSPTIKTSPASESLVSSAKEMTDAQKALDTVRQQALSSLDMSQKSLTDAISAKSTALHDELKADKKYAAKIKEIETMQQQMKDLQSNAEQKYNQTAGPLQQKVATDNALVKGLVPIVRKENGLPDTATFDPATQTWTNPAKGGK